VGKTPAHDPRTILAFDGRTSMYDESFNFYLLKTGRYVLRRCGVEWEFATIQEALTFAHTLPGSQNAQAEVFDSYGRRFLVLWL
jgi:hypothetical protein